MKKLLPILLLATIFQSCKFGCRDINETKGIWKPETFSNPANDTSFRPPDILKFGDTTVCYVNKNCELVLKGRFVGQFTGGSKALGSEIDEVRFHFVNMADGVYIRK